MAAKPKKSPGSKSTKRAKPSRSANKQGAPHKQGASKASKSVSARKSAGKGSETGQLEEPKSPMPAQHQRKPGIESKLDPRPRYEAPQYRGADKLKRKVALITGGDSGIGRAVAVLFAREGADVAFTYLPEEESDALETATAIAAEGSRALPLSGDLLDSEFCRRSVTQTVARLGKLDILVNNAAYQQHQKSLDDLTEEQWDRTFRTNIYAYFRMAKAALPHLQKGSAIINTGSITGLEGSKELLDYSATKGAIHAFTKSLAQNLVEKGIRVNCVAPGPVWTPLNPVDKLAKEVAEFGADTPMQRPAQPEEIAPAFVYFASEVDSSYVTGEILTLLGGETTAA
ncbi:MAG TPA: SDR family oxidoreductase [Pyrinomonadaceae bacterium]|nr:SDR family oxidoreductase [Pyrinomonadaceae bacterium]